MSFKRFDPEDIVLSSELITFPTWFVEGKGDFDEIDIDSLVTSPQQGASTEFFVDFYNKSTYITSSVNEETGEEVPTEETGFDPTQSKCMFSIAYAVRPNSTDKDSESYTSSFVPGGSTYVTNEEIIFGQYRSLVLGDEDSDFRFGNTRVGYSADDSNKADKFFAITVDRARFREKLEPVTCRLVFKKDPSMQDDTDLSTIIASGSENYLVLAPDVTANEKYLDSGRVYDLARYVTTESGSRYEYPDSGSNNSSYGYFLPDIGVILINADIEPFSNIQPGSTATTGSVMLFANYIKGFKLRSQETITSNYVFARARNAEFNYSTNPSNITGSAGNLRWGTMINQPQAFVTTVGLYNDSNELLAVAKLSKPLVKDFTKEALIRIKLDY
jgi:hypothetical protein